MIDQQNAVWLRSTKIFFAVGVLAFVAVVAVPLIYRANIGPNVSPLSSEWNNFGTFVGGVLGPVLSMLAFFALVYTIFLQEQQLSLARSGLEKADAEKAEQNRLSREQTATAAFFELLQLHISLARTMTIDDHSGSSAFSHLWESGFTWLYRHHERGASIEARLSFDRMVADDFFKDLRPALGPYLDNVFGIYHFVDGSDISDKQMLLAVVRAQLTKDELRIIYYYGLSKFSSKEQPLIEKYSMFANLDPRSLVSHDSYYDYSPAAWG